MPGEQIIETTTEARQGVPRLSLEALNQRRYNGDGGNGGGTTKK
jgi:hypothetical protein